MNPPIDRSGPFFGACVSPFAVGLVFVAALIASVSLSGCLAPPPERSDEELFAEIDRVREGRAREIKKSESPILKFVRERTLDILDAFSFRLTAGPGLRAHARVTKLLQVGIGKMGPAEATTMGGTVSCYKLGFIKREGGLWKERSQEVGISLFYYYHSVGESLGGNKKTFGEADRGFWDIGLAFHWLILGLEAEVRVDEAIDAAVGLFGIDLMGDDEPHVDPDLLDSDVTE